MPNVGRPSEPAPPALPSFSRILLVTDFSELARSAAPYAALIAGYFRGTVLVAHVITPEKESGAAGAQAEVDNARSSAEGQLRNYISESPLGEVDHELVIGQGSVWEVLRDIVTERQIDLVVLGTHGRSGVGKLLLGSVAQRIFSLAPCPVLTVSPAARAIWSPDHRLSRILYATNFSPESLKALPYALSLAKVSDAEVLLLHAPDVGENLSSDIVIGYQQHLNALISPEHRSWCRLDSLVTAGEPARAIPNAAAKYGADLIAIGAQAYEGSLAHFQVPMSIAYRVVAHAPCPVLRVRS